jgi:cell wall-associated NlpC family hydrolase
MRRLLRVEPQHGAVLALLLLVSACATPPRPPAHHGDPPNTVVGAVPERSRGDALAALASAQLGQPYRYGGDSPQGFDCSGLALFVHQQLGLELPRTALQQRQESPPLDQADLLPGDLVFFTMGPRLLVDHVGIYIGQARFVHAPRAGSPVRIGTLQDRSFARRFAGGGRYWASHPAP